MFTLQHLSEYEDIKFVNVAKEDVDMADDKSAAKDIKALYKDFVKWWKEALGDKATVKVRWLAQGTRCGLQRICARGNIGCRCRSPPVCPRHRAWS